MKAQKLPEDITPFLWSYDVSRLDIKHDKNRIVINTINYGNLRHWKWLIEIYSKEEVKKIIEETPASEFRPGALKLISLLLEISHRSYAPRGAYGAGKKAIA